MEDSLHLGGIERHIKTGEETGTEIRLCCSVPGSGGLHSSVCVWGLGKPLERQGVVITEGGDGEVGHSWVLFAHRISSRWGRNSLNISQKDRKSKQNKSTILTLPLSLYLSFI